MAGTLEGGRKAAQTIKEKYGADFHKQIGAKGGSVKNPHKGFGADNRTRLQKLLGKKKRAQVAGKKGGTVSRRGSKAKEVPAMAVAIAEPPYKTAPAPLPPKRKEGSYKAVVSVIPPHNTFYVFVSDKK